MTALLEPPRGSRTHATTLGEIPELFRPWVQKGPRLPWDFRVAPELFQRREQEKAESELSDVDAVALVLAGLMVAFGIAMSPAGLSRTFGSGSPDAEGAEWTMRNRRRIFLINKSFREKLSPDEACELTRLQDEMDRRLRAFAPLSTEILDQVRREAGFPPVSEQAQRP